jgi:pimeloyl-ACP methyl ester carboxylesterase
MLLHYTDQGKGEVVVLLHGMASSGRYWDTFIPHLGTTNRIITIDLLGYGRSPMPKDAIYSYESHVKSLVETLDHINIRQPITLVGHSMGALLSLRLASLYPERISRLVLVGMPIFEDATSAREAIIKSKLLNQLAFYGPTSHALCTTWCRLLRPISKRLATFYLPDLPAPVAEDSVLHTWQSYSQSMTHVIENQQVAQDIAKLSIVPILLYGDRDVPKDLDLVAELHTLKAIDIRTLPGTHQVVFEHPAEIAKDVLGMTYSMS